MESRIVKCFVPIARKFIRMMGKCEKCCSTQTQNTILILPNLFLLSRRRRCRCFSPMLPLLLVIASLTSLLFASTDAKNAKRNKKQKKKSIVIKSVNSNSMKRIKNKVKIRSKSVRYLMFFLCYHPLLHHISFQQRFGFSIRREQSCARQETKDEKNLFDFIISFFHYFEPNFSIWKVFYGIPSTCFFFTFFFALAKLTDWLNKLRFQQLRDEILEMQTNRKSELVFALSMIFAFSFWNWTQQNKKTENNIKRQL